MDKPRQVKYHDSANRQNQIMGGDRELVLCSALLSIILIVLIQTWWSALIGIAFWVTSMAVLKRMGKQDPMMRQVILRHLRYRDNYPAASGIDRISIGQPRRWQ